MPVPNSLPYDSFILPAPALMRNFFRCGRCGGLDLIVATQVDENEVRVTLSCGLCGNMVLYTSRRELHGD